MQHVLIDACGWVACMDAQLNVQADMEALLGPCTWVLLPSVERELRRLQSNGKEETLVARTAPKPGPAPYGRRERSCR